MMTATVNKRIEFSENEVLMAMRVSKAVAWKWSRVEADDVLSELNWWMCKNFRWVKLYREQGDTGRYKLATAMRRAAHSYAAGEQKERVGGRTKEDTQFYLREEVVNALPFMFDFADWAQPTGKENAATGHTFLSGDTGEAIIILSDISAAYYALAYRDQEILRLRFQLDLPYRKVAEHLDLTEDAARKRTDRAVDKLLARLSGGTLSWNVSQQRNAPHL